MTRKTKTPPAWNLKDLYSSINCPEIVRDLSSTTQNTQKFAKSHKGKVLTMSGEKLAASIAEYEDIQDVMGRIMAYAYLLYAGDLSKAQNTAFYQDMSEKINELSTNILFFPLEINKITDQDLEIKFASSKKLQHYKPWIRDVRVMRPYQLAEEVEEILHEKSITSRHSWSRFFDETLSGLEFKVGKKNLGSSATFHLLSSPKAETRKTAAKAIGKTLGQNIKTFAFITNTLAKDKEIEDKKRGFKQPISSRNISNLIEDEVAEALISTVKANYSNLSHRYYKIKAKWLGKNKLHYWDRNAPLPGGKTAEIPWDEAVAIVLQAYTDFSPIMGTIGKRFFDEEWIDACVRKGKESGAFSHPTVPSAHPYILMNYQGNTRDVMTLAHELGHGVHQVLSSKQGALMADTPLTLAETASVFGEQLTFRSLLSRETKEKQRKLMIAGKVEDMLNTVVRQVAFCEFETRIHAERKSGEVATNTINKIWLDVQKESLGSAIKFEDEYKYYWSYIPHFIHSPFYVYAYAFGECLVNSLYSVYETKPEGFAEKYIKMLEAGGTLRHKELLFPFGLDSGNPKFWQGGLDVISKFIDELE
jgi:oligoendopeptidase F